MATIEYDSQGNAHVTAEGQAAGVTVTWVPNDRNGGGTYDSSGYPWRLVYHEIQGGANYGSIASHPYPPHIWYDAERRILYQTVPLGRSAYALYQPKNTHYVTNKAKAIQVELGGYSDYIANEPQSWLDHIAEDVLIPVAQWIATTGESLTIMKLPEPWVIPGSASAEAPQRLSIDSWCNWDGICTHANVPANDHWDTGAMDIWQISQHAAYIIGGLLPAEQDSTVPLYFVVLDDGSFFAIYADGFTRSLPWDECNWLMVEKKIPSVKVHGIETDEYVARYLPSEI